MPLRQIDAAISAHAMWKMRLKTAIAQGIGSNDVTTAGRSDACDFGKWINSPTLPADLKHSPSCKEAARLHAAFHQVVSKTLSDVAAGRTEAATASMAMGGAFANASSALTSHMMKWKRELGAVPAGMR